MAEPPAREPNPAENGSSAAEQLYPIRRWTTENGLPQNRISCLWQGRDGYLWIGTRAGLARFDGWRFTVFDKFNTPELKDDSINALADGPDGALCIGTPGGLTRYSEHRFERVALPGVMREQSVRHLAASSAGEIWIQGNGNVTRWTGTTFSRPEPISSSPVRAMAARTDGTLEVLTDERWTSFSPDGTGLRTNLVTGHGAWAWQTGCLGVEAKQLWTGTAGGLRWSRGDQWETIEWPAEAGAVPRVTFVAEDRNGRLWVDMQPGDLHYRENGKWVSVNLGMGPGASRVVCLQQNLDGNTWVGTEHGLVQLHQRSLRAYTAQDGLQNEHVWSVCQASDGAIWYGTEKDMGCIRSNVVVRLAPDPTPGHAVRCVAPRKEGGVWAARTGYGVVAYDGKLHDVIGVEDLPDASISALYTDRAERLWIGTEKGVAVWGDGRVTGVYTNWCGRSDWDVRCVLEDSAGAVWLGTRQGLSRMRNGQFELFTTVQGQTSDEVWCLCEDDRKTLWIGTENGLIRYRNGRFFRFRQEQGLAENPINCILEDDLGYLWLSGLRGIYRIKREQLDRVANGQNALLECSAYGATDGMESSETNGESQPSGWKADDGRLWFPTIRGLVVINPTTIDQSEAPPSVIIEQILANGQKTAVDQTRHGSGPASVALHGAPAGVSKFAPMLGRPTAAGVFPAPPVELYLPPGGARVLELRYTATHFTNPERVRFAYCLEPHDGGWQTDDQNRRVAFYTDLAPGRYRFQVKACSNHGVWNETGAALILYVAPHFYETWGFYGVSAATLLGGALLFHGYRIRSIHRLRQLRQQHALEMERARIARDIHDDLGSRFTQIAVLQELAHRHIGKPDEAGPHMDKLRHATTEAFRSLDEIVWAANPKQDSLDGLISYLREYAPEVLAPAGIQCRLSFPASVPQRLLGAQARHQLFLVVKEALQNVVKHARATEVTLQLEAEEQGFVLWLKDNGRGFTQVNERNAGLGASGLGNGLGNMRERLESIGGEFSIQSAQGQGTTVRLRCPLDG